MLYPGDIDPSTSPVWAAPRRHGRVAPVIRAAVWPELAGVAPDAASTIPGAAVVAPQSGPSEDEVARLCAAAAARAVADAEGRLRAELAREADSALAELATALTTLADAVATRRERLRADAVPIGAALGRLLAYRAIEGEPLAAAEAVAGELLAELRDEPEVEVEVAATLVEDLRSRLAAVAAVASFAGCVEVRVGAGLRGGEVRLLWRDGWAERLLGDLDVRAADALEGLGRPRSGPSGPTAIAALVVEHGKAVEGEDA